ncbi:uncharacterized protein TNCV_2688691 [Trichonephila clavipes]|nr:uncharacterized protein TNCV_2688691 [Trichonephila clavipes]
MREKGCNRLVPGPDYMVDELKLSNQAPRASGESDGIQYPFCWPILAVSGQSLASNDPVVNMQSVPANIKARMWLQHDGAPAYFSADVRSALDTAYPGRWIRRGGPVNRPACSPDCSCLDFFLSGHMKSLVYASPSTPTRPWLQGLPS